MRNRDDKSKNKESKDKGLVFKTRDGNVCFFPTDNDRWNDNCDNKIKGIDEDCFDEIKEEILMCS
jgi:hypothetical protein